MLHVLATIGIIALIILLIIAVFIVLFLFVPFTYKVKAKAKLIPEEMSDEEKLKAIFEADDSERQKEKYQKDIDLKGTIHWLFHFLHVSLCFDMNGLNYAVRIIGIPILSSKKSDKKSKDNKKKKKKSKKSKNRDYRKDDVKLDECKEDTISEKSNEAKNFEKKNKEKEAFYEEEADKKTGIGAKIKNVFSKIKSVFEVLRDESTKKTISLVKNQLVRLIKEIRPRKFKGYIQYGTGDPVLTGKILGYISIFFGIIGKGCNIKPDFERKMLDADIFMKGHFKIIVLLSIGLKIITDKNIKKVIKKVRSK